MAFIGTPAELAARLGSNAAIASALEFVAASRRPGSVEHQRLLGLAEGDSARIDLDGGMHAMLMAYRPAGREAGRFETHRRHVDVQAVVSGSELMALEDSGRLEVEEDRSAERDAIFYRSAAGGSLLRLDERNVAVYFPTDAHLGGIPAEGTGLIRKVVVKVPVA